MSQEKSGTDRRNVPIVTGQGALSVMGWSMANPSIVLTFIAVSLGFPIFLAGILVTIRHAAGMLSDVFASSFISHLPRKKKAIALADLAIAACFLLVIFAISYATKPVIIATFVVAIFLIGMIEEIKSLLFIDFFSDNLTRSDRMRVSYTQKAIGGAATIALVLLLHFLVKDMPTQSRHAAVVVIGTMCFGLSALSIMAVREVIVSEEKEGQPGESYTSAFKRFWRDGGALRHEKWFRNYIMIRLVFVLAGLSVPFFALIAAEAHHTSAKGMTALVVSSTAALMVAAPLWRALSAYSNRAVMAASAAMVAISGFGLTALHYWGLDHTVHLDAAALFVVTIAVTGLGSARSLYFMDIAPKSQRIAAQAVSKALGRLAVIAASSVLAALAHANDPVWAVVAISIGSLLAVVVSLSFVPLPSNDTADQVQKNPT